VSLEEWNILNRRGVRPGWGGNSPPGMLPPLACDFTDDESLDAADLLILDAYFAGRRTALH